VQGEAQIAQAMVSGTFHQVFWYINEETTEGGKNEYQKGCQQQE
jgi:hypothetical protein